MAPKEGRAHPKNRASFLKALGDMKASTSTVEPTLFTSTGILSLDINLHGGLPQGRMVLWYGFTSTGKSTTAYLLAREQVRMGHHVLLIDAEDTFDGLYAMRLSIDPESIDVLKPSSLEQMWDMVIMALEAGIYSLIIIDSLAALSPETEQAASVSKQHMGLQPRINSQATRMWTSALRNSQTTVLMLNQERTNLSAYGAPNTNPGGKAIEHNAASVLYMGSKGKGTWVEGHPETIIFRYTVLRTKVFPPPIPYDYFELHLVADAVHYDIDTSYEMFKGAQAFGLLKDKDGNPWSKLVAFYNGENIGNGEKQILTFFDVESATRSAIYQDIRTRIDHAEPAANVSSGPSSDPGPQPEEPPPPPDFAGYLESAEWAGQGSDPTSGPGSG